MFLTPQILHLKRTVHPKWKILIFMHPYDLLSSVTQKKICFCAFNERLWGPNNVGLDPTELHCVYTFFKTSSEVRNS